MLGDDRRGPDLGYTLILETIAADDTMIGSASCENKVDGQEYLRSIGDHLQ